MANRRLSDEEIALIRGMLGLGMSAQDICGYLFRPNRSLNPAGVYEVRSGAIKPEIAAKSVEETKAFIDEHPYFGEMATADRVSELRKEIRGMLRLSKKEGRSFVDPKETDRLEFKESFHIQSLHEYARSLIGFANNKGGFIVFGVKDNCDIAGLKGNQFQNLDPKKFTEALKGAVMPNIEWHKFQFVYNEFEIGVLFSEESDNKPHITLKNYGNIKSDQIYFRYDGETSQIRPGELLGIISQREKSAVQHAISKLQQIAGIGVHQAEISPKTGASGEMVDDAHAVIIEKEVVRKSNLTDFDILADFVAGSIQSNASAYIEQAAHESVRWLPIYFYMIEGGLSREQTLDILDKSSIAKPGSTKHIKRRIQGVETAYRSYLGLGERNCLDQLRQGTIPNANELTAARHLANCLIGLETLEEFKAPFLRAVLSQIMLDYEKHGHDWAIGSSMRRAAGRVDELLFGDQLAAIEE